MHSGEPIPVGGDSLGPLASGGVSSVPIGWAHVYGSKRPDLFVGADKWYPGTYLYRWLEDSEDGVPIFGNPIQLRVPFPESRQSKGSVVETADGDVYGFWLDGTDVILSRYAADARSFAEEGLAYRRLQPRGRAQAATRRRVHDPRKPARSRRHRSIEAKFV